MAPPIPVYSNTIFYGNSYFIKTKLFQFLFFKAIPERWETATTSASWPSDPLNKNGPPANRNQASFIEFLAADIM